MTTTNKTSATDFIRAIIAEDIKSGKHSRVLTRFPPEPNGYLHIGHAKSICLNFSIGLENDNGCCHLRFDDTNPTKEETIYVQAIKEDIRWLGFDWGEHLYFASDYFEQLYEYAEHLIKNNNAYICSLNSDEIRLYRGTLTSAGKESPYRSRKVAENLDLFRRMRSGEFENGSHVLRAKIDMASGNLNLRDPVLYRILHEKHHRTGNKWCIYPMYDYAHSVSDAIEQITHSLCTLEFADHRPLYDWILAHLPVPCRPQQIEFARLKLGYTVVSKRKLGQLVKGELVKGWDDPRMATLSGMRRRGYTAYAVRDFCNRIGVARKESVVNIALLEHCVREDLNEKAQRVMAVLRPLKVVITNYPENQTENMVALNHPKKPEMGTRQVIFSREIYIEQTDFLEEPTRKFFRLAPGREVRLRYAYLITCEKMIRDEETDEIIEVHCSYDPATRGGNAPDGRKVKGTIHWVSTTDAVPAEIRLYDRLFTTEQPESDKEKDFKEFINPLSLETLTDCMVESSLLSAKPNENYQFERQGYFCVDLVDSTMKKLVFNRAVSLRDSWAKLKRNFNFPIHRDK